MRMHKSSSAALQKFRPAVRGRFPFRRSEACVWTFHEDLSRLRAGHGAKNMAVVRHFALNLIRQVADKRSIKRRRKRAAWDPNYLLQILQPLRGRARSWRETQM
jgi:hypothetical protein